MGQVLPFAMMALQTVGTIMEQRSNAKQQGTRDAIRDQQLAAQQQETAKAQSIENQRRERETRQKEAAKRTYYASAGIGGKGGSAQAVLEGLRRRTESEQKQEKALSDLSLRNLSQRNLLEKRLDRQTTAARNVQLSRSLL